MTWENIIGQEKVIELLKCTVASGHVAHAYLFHGSEGTGKRAVALAFAQALQCKGCDPNQLCLSCKNSERLHHPDIQVMIPEPNDVKTEDVARRISLLAEDPYAAVDFSSCPQSGHQKK